MMVERLKRVTKKDERELKAVYNALEPDKRPTTFEHVLRMQDWNGLEIALFVARNYEGKIRGFANASIEKSTGLGCSHWTCMHPRSRDAVTGRQLLKAKLNWLVNEAGASTVSAEAATPEGRALLRYFGFQPHTEHGWDYALLDFDKFKARTNYRE